MKKILVSMLVLCVGIGISTQAQKPNKFDFEKYKAEKIAYITEKLELTPVEAAKFWPIYNEYEQKKFEIMSQRRALEEHLREKKNEMSDKELLASIEEMSSLPIEEGELVRKYNKEFLKIIPVRKVVELYQAEEGFRRHLFKQYRDKKRNGDDLDETKE